MCPSWGHANRNFGALDGTTIRVGAQFRALRAGTIKKVVFFIGTVTSAQSLTAGLQDMDLTTGMPDGTFDASGTVAVPAANTFYEIDFGGSGKIVARNDLVAFVLQWTSTTGSLTYERGGNGPNYWSPLFTYVASWAKAQSATIWFYIEYDDGVVDFVGNSPIIKPADTVSITVSSATTPDEIGVRFIPSTNWLVQGFHAQLTNIGATDPRFKLYDANDNELFSQVMDKDVCIGGAGNTGYASNAVLSAPLELKAGQVYRFVTSPSDTQNYRVYYNQHIYNLAHATFLAQYCDSAQYTARTDGGAWTDTPTRLPVMGLIFEDLGLQSGRGIKTGGRM